MRRKRNESHERSSPYVGRGAGRMTVVEIIKRLKNFSPDAEVKVVYQGDNPFLTANPIGEIYEIKGHNEDSGVYLEI